MPLTVRDVTHDLIIIDAGESVFEATKKMSEKKIGSIIVEENGKPTGIISERDVITRANARDLDLKETKCREIMSAPLIKVSSRAGLHEATHLMEENNVKKLLVTDNDGKIVGVVSMTDLLRPVATVFDLVDMMRKFI
ncbi:CBS domain-containing protein [archaeon]|nr:CBS domain-containing protein [archaeon]